jgi:DNA adenine methylase
MGSALLRAARFIYLNKTCYNGLYRVNKSGEFNTPLGDYKSPNIADSIGIASASCALNSGSVSLSVKDFREALRACKEGDFVYIDPPYVPIKKSSFVSYTADKFDASDHTDLVNAVRDLSDRGVKVLLSNSYCAETLSLYEGLNIHEILAPRSINSKAKKRGCVAEIAVTNYQVSHVIGGHHA